MLPVKLHKNERAYPKKQTPKRAHNRIATSQPRQNISEKRQTIIILHSFITSAANRFGDGGADRRGNSTQRARSDGKRYYGRDSPRDFARFHTVKVAISGLRTLGW